MKKTKSKIYTCLALLAVVALALLMLSFAVPSRVKAENEAFNVSQILFAKPGENVGDECASAADDANGLPAYLYDEQNAGFKQDYTYAGALVPVKKNGCRLKYLFYDKIAEFRYKRQYRRRYFG